MGIKTFYADGNKVLDVYKTTNKAIKYIKKYKKPVFLEFATYRWREHCGPNYDNSIGYRTEKEFAKWKNKDPINEFKNYLVKNKIINANLIDKFYLSTNRKVARAFKFAEKSNFPSEKDLFKNIYA